jgi:hypothetical protein
MHSYYSAAVSRSAELVSCAQTAVKIAQSRHAKQQQQQQHESMTEQWFTRINPATLRLYDASKSSSTQQKSSSLTLSDDGLTLLRTMAQELNHLEGLVRRRGHSNDPTNEISASIRALEQDAAELTIVIQTLIPAGVSRSRSDSQRHAHYQALQAWFQAAAAQHAARLKQILAVRGTVLAEQATRRQRFVHSSTAANTATANSTATATAAANALFALPPPKPPPPPAKSSLPSTIPVATSTNSTNDNGIHKYPAAAARIAQAPPLPLPRNGHHGVTSPSVATVAAAATAAPALRAGYGGQTRVSYGTSSSSSLYASSNHGSTTNSYNEYYQSSDSNLYAPSSSSGMRQRKTDPGTTTNNNNNNGYQQQQLVQQHQEQRQSAQRLKEAVQAEKSLAALGTVFGKMSTLLQTQSETLTKIEDDVEAAQFDVKAGQEQISILYAIKKGNRPLILKVYGLLIFLIVFMRFYVKK